MIQAREPTQVQHLMLRANIKLGCKSLPMANTLAYFAVPSLTKKNTFITLTAALHSACPFRPIRPAGPVWPWSATAQLQCGLSSTPRALLRAARSAPGPRGPPARTAQK
jgi:hypothetical protein